MCARIVFYIYQEKQEKIKDDKGNICLLWISYTYVAYTYVAS